ncbi:tetratricopeptide repeat protein [Deferrisoma palaeochoriense]
MTRPRPRTVEVLDPVDRGLHFMATAGVLGALATGPALETPALGAGWPVDPGFLHGVSAFLVALAAGLHLVRVALWWLEGRNPWGLVPRPGDLADLVRACLPWAKPPPRGRFSHRERFGYLGFWIGLLGLGITGWAVAHPGVVVEGVGPANLVRAARIHSALGLGLLLPLGWHLYFALVAPEKLPWNAAWITGRVSWYLAARAWPTWVGETERPAEEEPRPPSVEDLLARGNQAAREGRWDEAAAAYREALALYPGYSQALFNLGAVYAKAGRTADARETLERFLEQDPFSPAAPRARELLSSLGVDRG